MGYAVVRRCALLVIMRVTSGEAADWWKTVHRKVGKVSTMMNVNMKDRKLRQHGGYVC